MASCRRYLILAAVLATAYAVSLTILAPRTTAPGHWPTDDDLFAVPGWTAEEPRLELGDGIDTTAALIQRSYYDASGLEAELVIWTNPQPQGKMLYRKGPDRDFLGDGYVIEPAPSWVEPPAGGGASVARRGSDAWLLMYTFGERRGLLGDGPLAWSLAELDGLLDSPNDYFLARVEVPFRADEPIPAAQASELTNVLFPRLAAWYANV